MSYQFVKGVSGFRGVDVLSKNDEVQSLSVTMGFLMLRSLILSSFVFVLVLWSFVPQVEAAEAKLIDQAVQFVQSDNGFHILHEKDTPYLAGVPLNWKSPLNYFNGDWQYRIQIIEHPTSQSGKLNMCLWNMPGFSPENCAFNISHSGLGVYYESSNPSINGAANGGWARIVGGPLDFLNPINYRISIILRGPNNCVVTTKQGVPADKRCPEYWNSFKDMRFRLTVVMVSEGSVFSGWDNYGFDDPLPSATPTPHTSTTPPPPTTTPPESQISPYPSIPTARTDCKHSCVWDSQSDPACKTRESSNMCGISADPSSCGDIDVPFVCAYASFDCAAGYCEEEPFDTTLHEQIIYCDIHGNPTTAATTGKLYTAVGCIPINDVNTFIKTILPLLLSMGGGVALLLVIYASFLIKTSAGDPRKLQAGRDLLTAAMAGLVLVIFSVFLLRVVGQNILQTPGL